MQLIQFNKVTQEFEGVRLPAPRHIPVAGLGVLPSWLTLLWGQTHSPCGRSRLWNLSVPGFDANWRHWESDGVWERNSTPTDPLGRMSTTNQARAHAPDSPLPWILILPNRLSEPKFWQVYHSLLFLFILSYLSAF